MTPLAAAGFDVAALILGGLLMAGALASGLANRSFLSLTAVVRARRASCWARAASACSRSTRASGFVHDLAIVALIVILFRDGLEVEAEMLQKAWRLPLRKLVRGDAADLRDRRARHALADRPRLGGELPASARCSPPPTRC